MVVGGPSAIYMGGGKMTNAILIFSGLQDFPWYLNRYSASGSLKVPPYFQAKIEHSLGQEFSFPMRY